MDDGRSTPRHHLVAAPAMVLAAVLLVAAVLGGAVLVASRFDAWRDPESVAETLLDQMVEAGAVAPRVLDPDDPMLARRAIVVTTAINEATAREVVERLLWLDAADPERPIDMLLSTQGGWTDSAFTIIDVMDSIRAPVNTWAVGGCYSAGAMILAAGTGRRIASPNAVLMLHANLEEPDGSDDWTALEQDRVERLWREHSRVPGEWYPMTGDASHYMTAERALGWGVIDEIRPAPEAGGGP